MPKFPSKVKVINIKVKVITIKLKIIVLWIWKGHFCIACQNVEGPWPLWSPRFLCTWPRERFWFRHVHKLIFFAERTDLLKGSFDCLVDTKIHLKSPPYLRKYFYSFGPSTTLFAIIVSQIQQQMISFSFAAPFSQVTT